MHCTPTIYAPSGDLLNASHESLRENYEVSTAAVEAVVQRLRGAGASGARLVGGGFGGSVLGLFAPGVPHPRDAREVRPGAGAHLLDEHSRRRTSSHMADDNTAPRPVSGSEEI